MVMLFDAKRKAGGNFSPKVSSAMNDLTMAVPAGTPPDALQSLNDTINDAISSEPMRSRLEGFGFTPRRMTLAECAVHVRNERAKWKRFVALAKIEPQ